MELIPIIKQALYVVTVLFVVTVAVSYIASKFKKPKKETPHPAIKPKVISGGTTTKTKTAERKTSKSKATTAVAKTKPSGTKSEKVTPEKIELPPNVIRKKSSRRKTKKKANPNVKHEKMNNNNNNIPRFEVVKDLKKAGNKHSNENNDIEFR